MKKLIALVLVVCLLAFGFNACAKPAASEVETPTPAETASAETAPEEAAPEAPTREKVTVTGDKELALVTDVGTIDDGSFNQGTWEGLKQYAEEFGKKYAYYQPAEQTDAAYIEAIELAIAGGAKVVVTPGFLFSPAITELQVVYPEITFIFIDADGAFVPAENTYAIVYAEELAGFAAGYAAVMEGYTKLGFMGGMAVPAVVRYGYGFVQGANNAASVVSGMPDGSVEIKYHYTGGFSATPEVQTLAASWYQSGTEIIFGCGGKLGNSVMAAAEQNGGKVIGVDVDQSPESETVMTSAMKMLGLSVYNALAKYYAGEFPGGKFETLGIESDAVGLPYETSRFTKFTKELYDEMYDTLKNDTFSTRSNIINDNNLTLEELTTAAKLNAVVVKEVL